MEKNYIAKIYCLTTGQKMQKGQTSLFDKSTNDIENAFTFCLGEKRVIGFENLNGIFLPFHVCDGIYIGKYGSMPTRDNADVMNLDYNYFEEQPKEQGSAFNTLFYADFSKQILIYLEKTHTVGFLDNISSILTSRDVHIKNFYYKDWKERIVKEIKGISSVEIKERKLPHQPSIRKLKENEAVYQSTKFKIKITPKDFIDRFSTEEISEEFDCFKVTDNKNKTFDFIKQQIKVSENILLDTKMLEEIDYLKTHFNDLISRIVNSNILPK